MEGEKQFSYDDQFATEEVGIFSDGLANEVNIIARRSLREKFVIALIIIVSFFAIFIGYYQFAGAMKKPFAYLINSSVNADESQCINGDCQLQNEILLALEQQQKDTDGDGLSNYEELNIYGTSPFLEDSDSDGFSDKQEVDNGYDPNCPGTESRFRSDVLVSGENFTESDAQSLLSGSADLSTLRSLLLDQGFPSETLNAISDDDLMAIYQQALSGSSEFDSSLLSSTSNNSTDSITSITDLQNLTGSQIRALMIAQGAPEDVLSSVSDDDLRSMFLSQLNSQID